MHELYCFCVVQGPSSTSRCPITREDSKPYCLKFHVGFPCDVTTDQTVKQQFVLNLELPPPFRGEICHWGGGYATL